MLLDAGEMSVATTGVKTITINQQLTKGIYWLAVVSDGAPTLLGKSVLTPVHNLSGGDPMPGWARAFTYAALPDPVGGTPSLNKYSSWVWLRLASLD